MAIEVCNQINETGTENSYRVYAIRCVKVDLFKFISLRHVTESRVQLGK